MISNRTIGKLGSRNGGDFARKHGRVTRAAVTELRPARDDYPIVVFSHLRWDFVWQRPQQFLSRLAQRHPILFVEAPVPTRSVRRSKPSLREVPEFPNLLIMQMELPQSRWLDEEFLDSERLRLVRETLAGPLGAKFTDPVLWFYDPMGVTAFAGQLDERAIVYDCMDELAKFRFAPKELIRRERELLSKADVVFAGGPKIHSAKVRFNSNCYSFGCGVDVRHFGKARLEKTKVPAPLAEMSKPILGFFGVVDERMDYELVANLADADPNWNVVIIGPTAKINPRHRPRRANLHWLGARSYSRLPNYTKGFDVCLMPFALNDATEYINPTKALEYMATGRPIVSTAVEDVVRQFADVVKIARSQDDFIAQCRDAVFRPDASAIRRGIELAANNSWEAIVAQLEKHVAAALAAADEVATTAA